MAILGAGVFIHPIGSKVGDQRFVGAGEDQFVKKCQVDPVS